MLKTITTTVILFFILHIVTAQVPDITVGLQAYYPFTGNAIDSSGNGNDGIVYGDAALTTDRFGTPNSAYKFDGFDDYINTFSTFDFERRTLSVWISAYDTVGSGGSDENTLTHVAITQDDYTLQNGVLRVDIDNGNMKLWAGGVTGTYLDPTVNLYQWYHLVLIRDIDSTKYYINGKYVGSGTSDNIGSSYNPNNNFIIGCGRSTNDQFFNGKIDDIRIYDRVLNECEINYLYSDNPSLTNHGLLAHYPFSGNANDSTGHGHDGVVFGNPTITTDRFGNLNSAYEFDGVDDYIDTYSTFDYDRRSVSAWINPYDIIGSGGSGDNTLVHVALTQDDYNLRYGLFRIDIDNEKLKLWAGGAYGTFEFQPINVNNWYHIVLVRNEDTTRYYVNGEFLGNRLSDSIGSSFHPNNNLIIGAGRSTFDQFFKGKIDDIRIYSKALNSCEIDQLYNEGIVTKVETSVEAESIRIYPNPFTKKLTVQNGTGMELTIEIFDNSGRLIKSQSVNGQNSEIILDRLHSGIYLLKYWEKDILITKKFIKL
ncbi:MAG: T9SS type A sorting domain-containing protein [Bacteroidales bacterium]|nr:T9SS type A sorting domain-containing protein [Bacteroidales bacterium]